MGVQGLWELLAPVGRRVSVETLAGRKLAIDASIWIVQFMKAMRDEKGEMLRNAHILGFFRRICKLLFLRTKPVFVFDGGTPALKRRTVAARRRQRENARAKIRKTAEKLLLNHLKAKRLEDLAQEIKNDRAKEDAKGKKVVVDEDESGNKSGRALDQESFDAMLAASLAAEEEELNGNKPTAKGGVEAEEEDDEDEEIIFPVTSGNVDPSVLASLPPSMQLDLLVQMRERLMAENRQKYQKIKKTPTKFSELQIQSYLKTVAFRREIDEVQKCAAGRGIGGVQSSRIASEANREFIFSSSFTGDKQILSSTTVANGGDSVHQTVNKSVSRPVNHALFTSHTQSPAESSVSKGTNDFGCDVETYCDHNGHRRVSRVRGLGIRMTRDLQRNLDLIKEYEQDSTSDMQSKCASEVSGTSGFAGFRIPGNFSKTDENIGRKTGTTQEDSHSSDELSVHVNKASIEISFVDDDCKMKDIDDDLFLQLVSGTSASALFTDSYHSGKDANESESECMWEDGEVEKSAVSHSHQNNEGISSLAEPNICEENEVEWEDGGCDVPEAVYHCQAELEKVVPRRLLEEEADIQEAIRRSLQGETEVEWEEGNCDDHIVNSHSQGGHEKEATRGLQEEEADIQEAIRRSLQEIEKKKVSTNSSTNESMEESGLDRDSVAFNHVLTLKGSRKCTQVPPVRHLDTSSSPSATVDGHERYYCQENVAKNVDPENHFPSSIVSEINFDAQPKAAEATVAKHVESSALDDREIRISHADEVIEHCINQEEQSPRVHEQAGVVLSPGTSKEDLGNICHVGVSANFRGNQTHNAESSHPVVCRSVDDSSEKVSSMEKEVNKIDMLKEGPIGNSSDIPAADGTHLRGETATHEEFNNLNVLSEDNLDEEISLLIQERADLGNEQKRLERNAESVSSEMFAECQELLQMFGLPYIIAPMEAEAQCAYMEMSNLVDGVVTDDSDVFLFGARNVYKNIFDDRKYVETYFMKDIESELGLNRGTLIRMALLLGSDYTEGVSGIGIVNAIEVVRAFPEEDGLQKFREWIESPDPSILGKLDLHTGNTPKKKSTKSSNQDIDNTGESPAGENPLKGHDAHPSSDDISYTKEIFMTKHRNVSKNWNLPSTFPSQSVITAYISPQIDDSTDPFKWGKPDLLLLRKLCWERFGWDNKKANELLVPVLKEYSKHETQLRLEAFYTFNERFAKIRSQRIKQAVKGITGKPSAELTEGNAEASGSKKKKRATDAFPSDECGSENCSDVKDSSMTKVSKKPKRPKNGSQNVQSEAGDPDTVVRGASNGESGANMRGMGRGRGRGRGRGKGRGRGRGTEEMLNYDTTEASSDDCDDTCEVEQHTRAPVSELRRSIRQRKHIKYAEEDFNEEDGDTVDASAKEQEPVSQGTSIRVRDVSNHEEGVNSANANLSGDYLFSGGGFCMDEDEAQGDDLRPVSSTVIVSVEKDNAYSSLDCGTARFGSFEKLSSSGHLISGGGFCTDENETQDETINTFDSRSGEISLLNDGQTPEEPRENLPEMKRTASKVEEAENEGEADLGLRAMPLLRRKRRKY